MVFYNFLMLSGDRNDAKLQIPPAVPNLFGNSSASSWLTPDIWPREDPPEGDWSCPLSERQKSLVGDVPFRTKLYPYANHGAGIFTYMETPIIRKILS